MRSVRTIPKPAAIELPFDRETWRLVIAELRLTPKFAEVVELLLLGKRDKQIAAKLGIAEPTVRTYLARIFVRVDAADRIEVVLRVFAAAWRLRDGRTCPPSR